MIQPCKSVVSSHLKLTLQTKCNVPEVNFLTNNFTKVKENLYFFFQRVIRLFIQQTLT